MWGPEIHRATVQGGFMTSKRKLAQEILIFTSEASTLGSNGTYPEEARQGLKGWKEDRNSWLGQGGRVSTRQDWFFGKASRGWDTGQWATTGRLQSMRH